MSAVENQKRVAVLMATYNGESFIEEQIYSILKQEDVAADIYIADDCSTDSTVEIIKKIQDEYPSRIFVEINKKNLGCAQNFMELIYRQDPSRYDYFAFSDQDDVWTPQKLNRAISCLQMHNKHFYCSNFTNVTSDNYKSLGYRDFQYAGKKVLSSFINNYATGCTQVFDSEFLRLIQKEKVKLNYFYHDAWTYSVALFCSSVYFDQKSDLLLRRISNNNVVGIDSRSLKSKVLFNIKWFKKRKKSHTAETIANYILKNYKNEIHPDMITDLTEIASYEASLGSKLALLTDKNLYSTQKFRNTKIAMIVVMGWL